MQGYDPACSVHANSVTHTWKFMQGIDASVQNWFESANCPHRQLCFKKLRTTTTAVFLIFSKVVVNPYSHSIWSSIIHTPYLKFKVRLIGLAQSDIQILYGLQIDNGISCCVNSSWTGSFNNKFVVHDQYIRFAILPLISIYQKWYCCYVNRSRSVQEWMVFTM